jgi:hypothetical protein
MLKKTSKYKKADTVYKWYLLFINAQKAYSQLLLTKRLGMGKTETSAFLGA